VVFTSGDRRGRFARASVVGVLPRRRCGNNVSRFNVTHNDRSPAQRQNNLNRQPETAKTVR